MDLPVRIDEDGVAICFVVSGGPGGQRLALVNLDALAPGRKANLVLEAPARFLATQTFAYAPEPYFKGRFAIEDANRVVLASIDRNGPVIGPAVAAA